MPEPDSIPEPNSTPEPDAKPEPESMTEPSEVEELFRQTLHGDYDDEDEEGGPWEAVSKLQALASREVLDQALAWARDRRPARRRRGIDILAQLGKTPEHPSTLFAEEIYPVVTAVLADEQDFEVIDSCLVALGHLANPDAIPLILRYRRHADPDVRFAAAFGLSCFANHDEAIAPLIDLTRDADPDIRDWATFGLGVQGSIDSPEIRKALLDRLDDGNADTREEAIAGLGKRKELRVLPDLIEMLQQDEVSYGVVEAACHLLDFEAVREDWSADQYIEALTAKFSAELERYS